MKGKVTIGRVGMSVLDAVNVPVDRSSTLGNPFPVANGRTRDEACDMYEVHFRTNLTNDPLVLRMLASLRGGHDVHLQCWCHPKRCHAETIARFLTTSA